MQKALVAMAKDGHCKEFLRVFAAECLSEKNEDHSLEWKEGLDAMSTAQWQHLCEYMRLPLVDLHITACLTCLCWSLRDSLPTSVVFALSDVIVHLHGHLLQATPDAQDAIAQCCEAFWISHASRAEAVIPQLIPYLVVQALDGETVSAVKRLRDVQDALSLLDFEDTSSRYVLLYPLAFFEAKQVCDPMLYRLLEPMLWRGLSATNDQVRKQAAIVLFQGFPYQKFHLDGNKSASKEDTDALLQKQQFLFWLFELVQDTASTAVRVAVLQGLPLILDNHLSHAVLKSLLPKLAPYLNDKQETVRAAFCRLLVRVKSIRNMHFYDIAPVDSCLLRLVMDAARPSVAKPITNLFLRSYFPQTDGALVYLSYEGRDALIVTSKSSEMNVAFPASATSEDYIERPIPEQFVHRITDSNTVVSDVSDLYSH
ncbi:hypothetical protein B5M09_006918 [Aphanomyces astaci]|uniref:Adenylate cyclase-associated CAP C-terminal domain-containing protein n=1 Tax=Aphanomyces astaci TaxID=112090 RepID=A0A425DDW6_APHAT|nr:hypothetical protein B5M09_006918 [Aphanomyces astaci]